MHKPSHFAPLLLSMAAFNEAIRLDPSKQAALQPMLAKLQTPLN